MVKGGTNTAAYLVGIREARCANRRTDNITRSLSRKTVCVFKLSRRQLHTSRSVLPHLAQFIALIALTKEFDVQT
jgi:hypothetical protein